MTDLGDVFDDLVAVEIRLWNAIHQALRDEADTTIGTFLSLRIVRRTPSCRVQDIAEGLSITVGGASKIVDRLEAAGQCARRANPDDRRSSIVELTAAGEHLVTAGLTVFERELQSRLAAPLAGRKVDQLAAGLAQVKAALD